MTAAREVLASIDAALEDWTVSADAMRCTPDPAPSVPAVPVVRTPPLAIARTILVRRLTEYHALTLQTARQAVADAEAGLHTEHTGLVHAEARAVVANTTHAAASAVAAFLRAMRPALEAMAQAAQRAAVALASATSSAPGCPAPHRRLGRPAWQSPYGPAQRRRNR
ncbi:hypothetical protein [Streptomyces sp. NPDC048385]|uniref:hypothetical protein n=1 Tax=unclassified Streptomyces TaxID=2593676 RepID=UPI00343674E0